MLVLRVYILQDDVYYDNLVENFGSLCLGQFQIGMIDDDVDVCQVNCCVDGLNNQFEKGCFGFCQFIEVYIVDIEGCQNVYEYVKNGLCFGDQ